MANYLQTVYQGFPLYYAGKSQNTIRLEPQRCHAILFISEKAAAGVAKNLAEKYQRDDFSIVQQHE
ncbi:hypothetical protein [Bartonella machadoae]|uniref:hypothetical protein n=1 Tax=Bartonella machadoae TaxID=2893471 RepID=UPI001F4CEF37|nr:hypothetical protein [Bartonella machadoae]UNE53918.1 hypothetical protein LNM86_10085 [Bartonella machadoae]